MDNIDNLIIVCESLMIPLNYKIANESVIKNLIEKAKNFIKEFIRKIKILFDKINKRELLLVDQEIYKYYMNIYDNLDRINIGRLKDDSDIEKIENELSDLETKYNELGDRKSKSENGKWIKISSSDMNKKQKDLKKTIDNISKSIRELEKNDDKTKIKILTLNQKKATLQLKIVTSIFNLSGDTLTKSFYDAIDKNDTGLLRIMLRDSLLIHLTHNEANAMMQRISSSGIDIFDPHDGEEFEEEKSKWNDDYMKGLRVDILNNFSKERWNHLKQVVRHLRPYEK